MKSKGKTENIPKNIFIFDYIVPLRSSRQRMQICCNVFFMSWKSKEMNKSQNCYKGGGEKQNGLIVIFKYMTSSINISTLCRLYLLFWRKEFSFQKAQLPLFNLDLNWLSMSHFPWDHQACRTGNLYFIHPWSLYLNALLHLVKRCSRKCVIENTVFDLIILLDRKTGFWIFMLKWTKSPKNYLLLVKFRIMKVLFLLSEMCFSRHIGCLRHIYLLPFLLTEPQFCSSIGLPWPRKWMLIRLPSQMIGVEMGIWDSSGHLGVKGILLEVKCCGESFAFEKDLKEETLPLLAFGNCFVRLWHWKLL